MKIKAGDIRGYQFKKSWRGYDPVEVRYFLEMLAEEFGSLQERLTQYERESEARAALSQTATSIREARQQAQGIVHDAESVAAETLKNAKADREEIKRTVDKLIIQRDKLVNDIQTIVKTASQLIEAYCTEEDFNEDE